MAYDIFISYATKDFEKAEQLVRALRHRWSVFWAPDSLPAGSQIVEEINRIIETAKCVIVAWSEHSKKSNFVCGEALRGLDLKKLIPVMVEDGIRFEVPFNTLNTISVANWDGDLATLDRRIVQAIKDLVEGMIMETTFAMLQDLLDEEKSADIAPTVIVQILLEACQQSGDLQTSAEYRWEPFKKEIIAINLLHEQVNSIQSDSRDDWLRNDVSVLAARVAILAASAVEKSTAGMAFVVRASDVVFQSFDFQLDLSQFEQYDLFRNAYDAARGWNEYDDNVLLVLRHAIHIADRPPS